MLFFYFDGQRAIHHHRYWVHDPVLGAVVACEVLALLWRSPYRTVALACSAHILLHLLLDSICGGIIWPAPFNTELWALVSVPACQSKLILWFALHWRFVLETLLSDAAVLPFIKGRKRNGKKVGSSDIVRLGSYAKQHLLFVTLERQQQNDFVPRFLTVYFWNHPRPVKHRSGRLFSQ